MKCPMCLGKGYATDEDIKEYPHRCPNCNGKWFYSADWQTVRCEVCNGSGKKPQTNEEWFANLPTEEKAKFIFWQHFDVYGKTIYELMVNASRGVSRDKQAEVMIGAVVEWLKEVHNADRS